jgi:hypothetical protein
MLTNEKPEKRPDAFKKLRLNEVGSGEFRSYERTVYESLQDRHLFLFDQYPRIFQPQQPIVLGNSAVAAYGKRQDEAVAMAGREAMGTSDIQHDVQSQPYNQVAQAQQTEIDSRSPEEQTAYRMAMKARDDINRINSGQPDVDVAQPDSPMQPVEDVLQEVEAQLSPELRAALHSGANTELANA